MTKPAANDSTISFPYKQSTLKALNLVNESL